MPAEYLTLLDYRRSFVPVLAMPCMKHAKRAVSDGLTVWVSTSMYAIGVEDRDVKERDKCAVAIEVVRVRNLEKQWQRAAF